MSKRKAATSNKSNKKSKASDERKGYIITVEVKVTSVDIDDEAFVDCYGEEIIEMQESIVDDYKSKLEKHSVEEAYLSKASAVARIKQIMESQLEKFKEHETDEYEEEEDEDKVSTVPSLESCKHDKDKLNWSAEFQYETTQSEYDDLTNTLYITIDISSKIVPLVP